MRAACAKDKTESPKRSVEDASITKDSGDREALDASSTVEVLPLGSGGEVGRSCVVVTHRGARVMFDCGIHPARHGVNSLPLFDLVNLGTIEAVLVTHFHLDHCGALPYLCNETNFRGRIFMTHPTKAFYRMVLQDYAKVSPNAHEIVTEEWITTTLARVETIDYHESVQVDGGRIRFHSYNAGHVLGAAMFFVELNGVTVLYTGDYSRSPDRHLVGAESPLYSPDILIVESTYGIINHEPREEREAKFLDWAVTVVQRGGRCLVPVFALGRAQELLLILEEYWAAHPELHSIPVYYISSMSKRCMQLYATYGNAMNERVKRRARNPFQFSHIECLKDLSSFHDDGPCVVLASPGMLQTGVSRELFEKWCGDRRNGVIIAGYCVDGTLAREITTKPKEITREDGRRMLPLRMGTIGTVSFSAHSDFQQTRAFLNDIPDVRAIVLVHGNQDAMRKLADRLRGDLASANLGLEPSSEQHVTTIIHESANGRTIPITVYPRYYARLVGSLANSTLAWWADVQPKALRCLNQEPGALPQTRALFVKTKKSPRGDSSDDEDVDGKGRDGASRCREESKDRNRSAQYVLPVKGVLIERSEDADPTAAIPMIVSRDEIRTYANVQCYDRLLCGVHIPMPHYFSITKIHQHLSKTFTDCVLIPEVQDDPEARGTQKGAQRDVVSDDKLISGHKTTAVPFSGCVDPDEIDHETEYSANSFVLRIGGHVRVAITERSVMGLPTTTGDLGSPAEGHLAHTTDLIGAVPATDQNPQSTPSWGELEVISSSSAHTIFISWPMYARLDILGDAVCIALLHLLEHRGSNDPVRDVESEACLLGEEASVRVMDRKHAPDSCKDDVFRARASHSFLCQHFSGVHLRLSDDPKPRLFSTFGSSPEGSISTIRFTHLGEVFLIDALTLQILEHRISETSSSPDAPVTHACEIQGQPQGGSESASHTATAHKTQPRKDVERVLKRMALAMFPIALLDGDGLCECPPCLDATTKIY